MDRTIRKLYAELIATLRAAGRTAEADACAEVTVRHGVWRYQFQRPIHYIEELPLVFRYDARRFWIASYLERHFNVIRDEVSCVTNPDSHGFRPVEEPLVQQGRWDHVVFHEGGQRFDRAARDFPKTAAILDAIPQEQRSAGTVMLSWLHPGTHIVGHCGHTNGRLRVHLGIKTPAGARMRLHESYLEWQAGKCLIFDDSIEHEVWHEGSEPRIVLLFDILHPALREADRIALTHARGYAHEERARFMKDRGLRRIELVGEETIRVDLDRGTELALRRYLSDSGISSLELAADGQMKVV